MEPRTVDVFVEIPKGSRNKYEWDHESATLRLDRVLYSPMIYPADYGFVLGAWGEDEDPLDAMVMLDEPTFPGCVIEATVIGVFWMTDDNERDTKMICVPKDDPVWASYEDLSELPQHLLREIEHFFEVYKDLEGKETVTEGFGSRDEAVAQLDKDIARFNALNPKPAMPVSLPEG